MKTTILTILIVTLSTGLLISQSIERSVVASSGDYFEGADDGIAVFFTDVEEFDDKPKLNRLQDALGFRPPQSFRYVSNDEKEFFELEDLLYSL